MKISKDKVVSIEFTLRDDKGTIIDSSEDHEPMAYIHGIGNLVPGLESQLEGRSAGESLNVTLSPSDGYGEFDKSQIVKVPRSQFSGVGDLAVGMQFTSSSPEGEKIVTITSIDKDIVTVNGNHALAGKILNFEVKIVGVREATAEEHSHGHVHGAGGHHH